MLFWNVNSANKQVDFVDGGSVQRLFFAAARLGMYMLDKSIDFRFSDGFASLIYNGRIDGLGLCV